MANNYYRKSSNSGLKIFAWILAIIVIVEGVVIAAAVGSQGFTKGFNDWFDGWGKVEQPLPEEPGDGPDNPEIPTDEELPENNSTDAQTSAGCNAIYNDNKSQAYSTVSGQVFATKMKRSSERELYPLDEIEGAKIGISHGIEGVETVDFNFFKNSINLVAEKKTDTNFPYLTIYFFDISINPPTVEGYQFADLKAYYYVEATESENNPIEILLENTDGIYRNDKNNTYNVSSDVVFLFDFVYDELSSNYYDFYAYKEGWDFEATHGTLDYVSDSTDTVTIHVNNTSETITVSAKIYTSYFSFRGEYKGYLFLCFDMNDSRFKKWKLVAGRNNDCEKNFERSDAEDTYMYCFYWDDGKIENYNYTVYVETVMTLPDDPVKEGYNFVGWYYDEEFTRPYDGAPIYEDTQLYAKFEIKTFTVIFDTDGAGEIDPITVEWNDYIHVLPEPSKEGHCFVGWHLPNGKMYSKDAITENVTLTAHWTLNQYVIMFETNGGNDMGYVDVNHGETYTPATPVKEGYTFKGWYEDEGFTKIYDSSAPLKESKTLFAKWEISRYTITYVTNGGEPLESDKIEHGYWLDPRRPVREGYSFMGWYEDEALTIAYDSETPITNPKTLYAKWEISRYTITFYVDGEVYTTVEVEYGTKLVSVMLETANLMNLCVTSMGVPVEGNFAEIEITENLDVTAVEMTDTEKVFNVIKNYMWWIVGGVGGAIVVIGIIVAIACAKKPKKITAGAKSPTKRGKK